ncbi:MAG TPA: sulfite exporter TauE/SafE family protein [Pirellulales bacterium]|jgi:hypothetical protein
MNELSFTVLVGLGSLVAGFLGSMTGLGGGVVIVPLLTIVFGVDLRYAIGASLVSVIATSSGAAAAYVREGYSNIRVGMFLEVATTMGAIVGAFLAFVTPVNVISIVFGVILLASAALSVRRAEDSPSGKSSKFVERLHLDATYPTPFGPQAYSVQHVPLGFGLMLVAGVLSGLLGIGSGAFKVIAMDQVMRLPFKVSTTTSNFMIGVTAAASAGVYLNRGYVSPTVAMPVMLGVLAGSMLGARVLMSARVGLLRIVFAIVVVAMACEMIHKGLVGNI